MDYPSLWLDLFSLFYIENVGARFRIFIGNHSDTNNPFHWYHVQFNLLCTTGYDPILPCVQIICFDEEVFLRVTVFFDDGCVYGLGAECVQYGLRKICAGLQLLGNQEAARKHTAGGQRPQDCCACCVYND